MSKKAKGNRYDEGFKADALSLVKSGRNARDVAKDLGVSYQALRDWIRKYDESKDS